MRAEKVQLRITAQVLGRKQQIPRRFAPRNDKLKEFFNKLLAAYRGGQRVVYRTSLRESVNRSDAHSQARCNLAPGKPLARATASPDRAPHPGISSRSNSAMLAKMPNTRRPFGVEVSTPWCSETKLVVPGGAERRGPYLSPPGSGVF